MRNINPMTHPQAHSLIDVELRTNSTPLTSRIMRELGQCPKANHGIDCDVHGQNRRQWTLRQLTPNNEHGAVRTHDAFSTHRTKENFLHPIESP